MIHVTASQKSLRLYLYSQPAALQFFSRPVERMDARRKTSEWKRRRTTMRKSQALPIRRPVVDGHKEPKIIRGVQRFCQSGDGSQAQQAVGRQSRELGRVRPAAVAAKKTIGPGPDAESGNSCATATISCVNGASRMYAVCSREPNLARCRAIGSDLWRAIARTSHVLTGDNHSSLF